MDDQFARKAQQLEGLESRRLKLEQHIGDAYQALWQEFQRRYPPLKMVEEVVLNCETMQEWLASKMEGDACDPD